MKMKMIYRLCMIVTILVFSGQRVNAQESTVTMTMSEYNKIQNQMDTLMTALKFLVSYNDSTAVEIGRRDMVIDALKQDVDTLKSELNEWYSYEEEVEEIFQNLQDSISMQKKEIEQLKGELSSLDMVRLRYANGRLTLPFDRQKVAEALELFDGIKDADMKELYKEVPFWLNHYEKYNESVSLLIHSLQDSPDRMNRMSFDEWKKRALAEISNNDYYKTSRLADYKILYLDDILETAAGRIKRADPPKIGQAPLDFSDLIDRLTIK